MRTNVIPKSILVPVDYGTSSKRALEQAATLARRFKAKLVLVFAWAAPFAELPLASERLATEHQSLFDLVRQESESTMIGFIREVQADLDGVDLEWIIVSGNPAKVILDQAEAGGADLIVMGSQGGYRAVRWVLGSVTEAVVRRANCPVLVVPRREEAA